MQEARKLQQSQIGAQTFAEGRLWRRAWEPPLYLSSHSWLLGVFQNCGDAPREKQTLGYLSLSAN